MSLDFQAQTLFRLERQNNCGAPYSFTTQPPSSPAAAAKQLPYLVSSASKHNPHHRRFQHQLTLLRRAHKYTQEAREPIIMLFFSFFKTLIDQEVMVELKNDIRIRGILKSVDQYLNIKLENIQVVEELKYPHLSAVKNVFIRGSVVRYVHLPPAAVDVNLLEDATRRGKSSYPQLFFFSLLVHQANIVFQTQEKKRDTDTYCKNRSSKPSTKGKMSRHD
ncbi:hypothetical protein QBC35DRAFT_494497 [Podospora australis]|uniref:Sm domain-containing protein n=1 Tax=Podospora australis TaxID=1536484 RepID=A0AAN7AJK2_9PEZI|nr:hypothetical protein QBC35DRAFT_494497 [Podospora australis]